MFALIRSNCTISGMILQSSCKMGCCHACKHGKSYAVYHVLHAAHKNVSHTWHGITQAILQINLTSAFYPGKCILPVSMYACVVHVSMYACYVHVSCMHALFCYTSCQAFQTILNQTMARKHCIITYAQT